MQSNFVVTNFTGQSSHNGTTSVYQNHTANFTIYPIDVINNSKVVVLSDYSFYAHRIELIAESLRRKQAPKYQREYEKVEENN